MFQRDDRAYIPALISILLVFFAPYFTKGDAIGNDVSEVTATPAALEDEGLSPSPTENGE